MNSDDQTLQILLAEDRAFQVSLSEHFKLGEFLKSATASKKLFSEQFSPPEEIQNRLKQLTSEVLEPLRIEMNEAIFITSGYRCERLNAAVHGSKNSHHLRGMAADITLRDSSMNAAMFSILRRKFEFTQLIWYYADDLSPDFIHVSFDPEHLKKEVLICKLSFDGGTCRRTYQKWEDA